MKVTTISLNSSFHSSVNIKLVYEFIVLDDILVGKKFEDMYQGKVNTRTKPFCNQITLTYLKNGSNISIKIFANGQLQLSGCKSEQDAQEVIFDISHRVAKIQGQIHIKTFVKEGLLTDTTFRFIYGKDEHGYYVAGFFGMNDKISIHGTLVTKRHDGYFQYPDPQHTRTFRVFDQMCKFVGISQVILFNNRKHYSKSFERRGFDIYDTNHEIYRGRYVELFEAVEPEYPEEVYVARFRAFNRQFDIKMDDIKIHITSLNVSYKYHIPNNGVFRLDELVLILNKMDHKAYYFDTVYHAIRMLYFVNEHQSGHCICGSECHCEKITIMIFNNGNIILSGCRSVEVAQFVLGHVEQLLTSVLTDIVREDLKNTEGEFTHLNQVLRLKELNMSIINNMSTKVYKMENLDIEKLTISDFKDNKSKKGQNCYFSYNYVNNFAVKCPDVATVMYPINSFNNDNKFNIKVIYPDDCETIEFLQDVAKKTFSGTKAVFETTANLPVKGPTVVGKLLYDDEQQCFRNIFMDAEGNEMTDITPDNINEFFGRDTNVILTYKFMGYKMSNTNAGLSAYITCMQLAPPQEE